eukprot:9179521-Lingulodinium_polyedra.AAC.1
MSCDVGVLASVQQPPFGPVVRQPPAASGRRGEPCLKLRAVAESPHRPVESTPPSSEPTQSPQISTPGSVQGLSQ